jgi:hypothetical protein
LSILDAHPFLFGVPDAQRLVRVMAALYGDSAEAIRIVGPLGFDHLSLPPGLAPLRLWEFILPELAKLEKLRACVESVFLDKPRNTELPFLKALLEAKPKMILPGMGGSPAAARTSGASASVFRPWEFIHKFDRSDESGLLAQKFLALVTPPRLEPIVIGILAERADEYTYFVQRINSDNLRVISTNVSWPNAVVHPWASNTMVTAETEMRQLALRRFGLSDRKVEDLLQKLAPQLAGRPVLIELRSGWLGQRAAQEKLADFLLLWARLGPQDPPSVLYVAVVRAEDNELSLREASPLVSAAFARASGLVAVEPLELSLCEPTHFTAWREELEAEGKTIDDVAYKQLETSFNPPRFRLADLMKRLETSRIYS